MMDAVNCDAPPVLRPLTPALLEKSKKELNEKTERLPADILALRLWIHQQPHLRARTNDQFLVSFLRGTKFSLEKAKKKIDRYYTLKAALPEIFNKCRNVDDPLVMEIIRLGVILQIPLVEESTGPCITIIRAGSYDTSKYKFADIIRVGSMFGEIMMLEDDNATVSGYVEILDMDNITGTHLLQLQPELLQKFSIFADEAMPIRQKGTHFINVPTSFEMGFNTLKKFLPTKTLSRISINAGIEAIFEHVPQSCLPVEYGGENGCIQDIIDRMEAKILKYRDYFLSEACYGTDEKFRKGLPFRYENVFGIEGSFRKLDFD